MKRQLFVLLSFLLAGGLQAQHETLFDDFTSFGAFGGPIIRYPLVQETLADMRAETAAMVSGSLHVAHLLDRVEKGEADATSPWWC